LGGTALLSPFKYGQYLRRNGYAAAPHDQRLIGLFLLGLPAVVGLRFRGCPLFSCLSSAFSSS